MKPSRRGSTVEMFPYLLETEPPPWMASGNVSLGLAINSGNVSWLANETEPPPWFNIVEMFR